MFCFVFKLKVRSSSCTSKYLPDEIYQEGHVKQPSGSESHFQVRVSVFTIHKGCLCCQRRQWHPTPVLLPENPRDGGAWWAAVHGVAKSQTRLSDFTFTFHFPALEKAMATHSSVLAWRIPGTGEPGGLPSMGSHRVGHG